MFKLPANKVIVYLPNKLYFDYRPLSAIKKWNCLRIQTSLVFYALFHIKEALLKANNSHERTK